MPTDVLRASEIVLYDSAGALYRYPLVGQVQWRSLAVFPPKVTIGDDSRASEPLAASLVLDSWAGGILVRRLEPGRKPDVAYDASADIRYDREIRLPPRAVLANTGLPVTFDATGYRVYHALAYKPVGGDRNLYVSLYSLTDTKRSYHRWSEATQQWAQAFFTAAVQNADTGACIAYTDNQWWLLFVNGHFLTLTKDGINWVDQDATAIGAPLIEYVCFHDNKVWGINATTGRFFSTTSLQATFAGTPSWTERQALPTADPVALFVGFTAAGEPAIHAATQGGSLWIYDEVAGQGNTTDGWVQTRVSWPTDTSGALGTLAGAGTILYQGDMHIPVGTQIFRYDGRTVRPVGLDRESGLIATRRGLTAKLADGFSVLYVGTSSVEVNTASGAPVARCGVYATNGAAWYSVWDDDEPPGDAPSTISALSFNSADDKPRLWFATPSAMRYIDLPSGVFNPHQVTTTEYQPGGYLISPWYDLNWAELDKLGLALQVRTLGTSTTETVTVLYALNDDEDNWTPLTPITSPGLTTFELGGGAGIVFRTIRFEVVLARGTNVTRTPVVQLIKLRFLRLIDTLYAYNMAVDCSQRYGGRWPATLTRKLEDLHETQQMITFAFRRTGQPLGNLATKKVKITSFTGNVATGQDPRGVVQIGLAEV